MFCVAANTVISKKGIVKYKHLSCYKYSTGGMYNNNKPSFTCHSTLISLGIDLTHVSLEPCFLQFLHVITTTLTSSPIPFSLVLKISSVLLSGAVLPLVPGS